MKIELTPLNDQRTELWRWDTDRQIDITLADGEAANEAHFSNMFFNRALVVPIKVEGNTARADIPNILLQASQAVNVYVTAYSADGERTMHSAKLYVQNRPKPSDYVYTETEVRRYEQLEERLNELEEKQITEDNLKDAVNEYLLENPVEIKVDKALSEESENPVENKVVTKKISEVEKKIPTVFVGATAEENGTSGLVPAPDTGDVNSVLHGDGNWYPDVTVVGVAQLQDGSYNASLTFDYITSVLKSGRTVWAQFGELFYNVISAETGTITFQRNSGNSYDRFLIYSNDTTGRDRAGLVLSNRKVNGKELTSDVMLTAADVGALPEDTEIPTKLPNPNKLTFAGTVSAEYDGSGAVKVTIPEADTVRVEKTDEDTEVELEPNKFYVFPEMASLSVTLQAPQNTGITNEYHFVFKSGETATTLTLPEDVTLPDGFTVNPNKIYELSILEGMLLAQSWAVEE